jgi:hypothetical protein
MEIEAPPTYEEALLSYNDDIQPVYFSSEAAHEGQLIYGAEITRDQCPLSLPASTASFKQKTEGIESFDRSLQKDRDALWAFFLTHLTRPKVEIFIEGSSGSGDDRSTHFNMTIDVSQHVNDWKSLATSMIDQNGKRIWFKDVIEDFTKSGNVIKQINVRKWIDWDSVQLKKAIGALIKRSTNYEYDIETVVRVTNNAITVHSDSFMSKFSQSWITKGFCIISCLWIVFLPIYRLSRKYIHGKILAHYPMAITESDFYYRNAEKIVQTVKDRKKGVKWACP